MMLTPTSIAFLIVIGFLVLILVGYLILAGGDFGRIRLATRCEWRILRDPAFAAKVEPMLKPAEKKEIAPPKPSGAPVRLLALLQREGRLLDFLLEDLQAYPDDEKGNAQIGAAVRTIHRQCQATLKEHLILQPVLPQPEGSTVEISKVDPSSIQLVGNVTGQPPFRGTLQHHGWRVTEIKLPPLPEGQDELILMPAEVDLA